MAKTKSDSIEKMLSRSAAFLPEATTAFYTLITAMPAARPNLLEKLHAVEQDSDERYVRVLRKTAGSFITPYDREDIFLMIETLDDVIDQLDHVGILVVGFEIDRVPHQLVLMAQELIGVSEQIKEAVGLLKKQNKLEKCLYAINSHFNTFDNSYRSLLISTLSTADTMEPKETTKIIALGMGFERACQRLNDLTRALAVAAIKET